MENKLEESIPASLTSRHVFRGIEYILSLTTNAAKEVITVEVEDRLTADQWRAQFDARYIEDLTHRTGNFKQFLVFVSMLESGLMKNSSAVTLDLLTYADLESLRSGTHKPGTGTEHIPAAASKGSSQLNSKRYLIMTYSVEFDRIHYPLPLPYVGKPDPVQLQETVRTLREENRHLKNQLMKGNGARKSSTAHLQRQCEKLTTEKENLEQNMEVLQRDMKLAAKGNKLKEIRVLKKVVQSLESEMMKEKNKYQRLIAKKNQEYRNIVEELEEVRSSERNLRARCRSLTNELAVLKKGSRISPALRRRHSSSSQKAPVPRRSTSMERRPLSVRSRTPSPSGSNVPRFNPTAYVKAKQQRQKEIVASRSRSRTRNGVHRARSRSLSSERHYPAANPDLVYKKSHRQPGVSANGRRRSRTSSAGSRHSSQSSLISGIISDSSDPGFTEHSNPRLKKKVSKTKDSSRSRKKTPSLWSSPDGSDIASYKKIRIPSNSRTLYSSTPDNEKKNQRKRPSSKRKEFPDSNEPEDSFNRSAEMIEIDARLNALQQFMKANLQS